MNRQKWVISDTQASYVSMAGLYASCVMLSGLPNDQTKFMADNPPPPPHSNVFFLITNADFTERVLMYKQRFEDLGQLRGDNYEKQLLLKTRTTATLIFQLMSCT